MTITALDVKYRTRTPGGDQFTRLVDLLIRAECFRSGIPDSAIHTNQRVNIGDQGVDTKVDQAIAGSNTGRFEYPTIWQYKANDYADVSDAALRSEIHDSSKEYARTCINDGCAYRFCICDSMPDSKRADWATKLTSYVREVNPNAPEAQVLTADDVAAWANRISAILSAFFQSGPMVSTLDLEA